MILSTTCVQDIPGDGAWANRDKRADSDSTTRSRSTSAGSSPPSSTAGEAIEKMTATVPAYLTIDESTPGSVSTGARSPPTHDTPGKAATSGLDEASPAYLSRGLSAEGCNALLAIKQVSGIMGAEDSPSFVVKDLNSTFNSISVEGPGADATSIAAAEAQPGRTAAKDGDKLWEAIEDMFLTPTSGSNGEAGSREPPRHVARPAAEFPAQPSPVPALVLRLAEAIPGSQLGSPSSAEKKLPRAQPVLRIAEALTEPKLGTTEMPTEGSAGHRFGTCKPCAFVHTKGCDNGTECQFCHICKPDELRRRKKAKRASRHGVISLGAALEGAF